MRDISKISKWFLRLILLLISFIFSIVVIFLFRPQYFIDDMERFLKEYISTSFGGNLTIRKIEGNFVEGFKVLEIVYSESDYILFSAGEIYIDPDLSQLITGTVALSEVVIHNSFFDYQQSNTENKIGGNINGIFNWWIEVASLVIENSSVIMLDDLYHLNGNIKLAYRNAVQIEIIELEINSPEFILTDMLNKLEYIILVGTAVVGSYAAVKISSLISAFKKVVFPLLNSPKTDTRMHSLLKYSTI